MSTSSWYEDSDDVNGSVELRTRDDAKHQDRSISEKMGTLNRLDRDHNFRFRSSPLQPCFLFSENGTIVTPSDFIPFEEFIYYLLALKNPSLCAEHALPAHLTRGDDNAQDHQDNLPGIHPFIKLVLHVPYMAYIALVT